MRISIEQLLFKSRYPYRVDGNKLTSKSEIKINYRRLNMLLFQLRIRGFDTDEGKIAVKLEAALRFGGPENTLRLKIISSLVNLGIFKNIKTNLYNLVNSILDGNFDNLDFWKLVLDPESDLYKLFFIEKFGNVSDLFDGLGIHEECLESDLSCFEIECEDQKVAYFDSGLNVKYQFSYRDLNFNRCTKAVKVLNKNAFKLYLEKYFEQNSSKGWFSVFDISKMGFANKAVSDDGKVVYGDPYMVEFTAVAQVIINKYLPHFGLKGVLARIGGDEFGFHLTRIDRNVVDKATTNFVSNFFYYLIAKIEIIRANENDVIGLSSASFKNNEKPIFYEIDDDIVRLIVGLSSIPDRAFHETIQSKKTDQIHELENYQSELRGILATKIDNNKALSQILSESATKMEIANGIVGISGDLLDLKLLDGFSGVRFQGLHTIGSGYLCFISTPFLKDVNDKEGSVGGDILKAKFEIEFFKELAKLPEVVLDRISIHKKPPKIILRIDKKSLSDDNLKILGSFISRLSNLEISITSDGLSSQKKYPILFSQSKSKEGDLRLRIDNLDESAVINWLKKIISKGDFLDLPVMNYLNSKKNGESRTLNCFNALTAMSIQSTTHLKETVEFLDTICALSGDKDGYINILKRFSESVGQKLELTNLGETVEYHVAEGIKEGAATDVKSFDEFYVIDDLTNEQLKLLISLNAMLQFNRQNGTINGLADGKINEYFALTLSDIDYTKVEEIHSLLLKNCLNNFLDSLSETDTITKDSILKMFIDLLRDFTIKQSKTFNDGLDLHYIQSYSIEEFNRLLEIFCKNFFKSIEYLRGVLKAVEEADEILIHIATVGDLPI